jgi:hypothetical protein
VDVAAAEVRVWQVGWSVLRNLSQPAIYMIARVVPWALSIRSGHALA